MFIKAFRFILIICLIPSIVLAYGHIFFEKKSLLIMSADGKEKFFTVEVADTEKRREYGLMYMKKMPEDLGMIFLFDNAQEISMWMKNTYIPLDIVFINNNVISKIVENTTPLSLETIPSNGKVNMVLELNAGICKKYNIKQNDRIFF